MKMDHQQALAMLKNGIVLTLVSGQVRSLFFWQGERVKVMSEQGSFRLNDQDFLDIYHNDQFLLYSFPSVDVDAMKQKDEEYYGWKHK